MTDKLAAAENQLAREQAERIAELEARLAGAEAANAAVELAEHTELNGHLEIVEQLHDYLAAEVCRDGDPTGKMSDFVNSLYVVIDQFDKQRRSRNWYEAAYTAGKRKLVESALAKVCCKGEPHTCDQEAIAAAEGRTDRLVLQLATITADRDALQSKLDRAMSEYDRMNAALNRDPSGQDWLAMRDCLREVTADRDRLLAEVERLRATLAQPHIQWAAEQHSVGVDIIAEDAKLRTRRDELLAAIARISQSTPLDSEVAEALEQRGKLLAEVGTLRAKIEEERAGFQAEHARIRRILEEEIKRHRVASREWVLSDYGAIHGGAAAGLVEFRSVVGFAIDSALATSAQDGGKGEGR